MKINENQGDFVEAVFGKIREKEPYIFAKEPYISLRPYLSRLFTNTVGTCVFACA